MKYSLLGQTGVRALGAATFGVAPSAEDADRIVGAALDLGINFLGTADVHGTMPVFDRLEPNLPWSANLPSRSSGAPCANAGRRW